VTSSDFDCFDDFDCFERLAGTRFTGTSVCGDKLCSAGTRFDFDCVTVSPGTFCGDEYRLFYGFPLVYNYEDGSFSLEYAIYSGNEFSSVEVKIFMLK